MRRTATSSRDVVPEPDTMTGFAWVGSNVPTWPLYPFEPRRILVTQTGVDRQPIVHADIILREELLVRLLPAKVGRGVSPGNRGRITQQKVRIGIAVKHCR